MPWVNLPKAAIAAVLVLAALPAAAQSGPPSLFRPKPAPESDAPSVPATAERMGITPEQFARLHVAANAELPNRPSRLSDGYARYEAPIAVPGPARHAVVLAPGAVLASEAVRVDEQRWQSRAPIAVGAPFNITVPAGSVFGGSLDENSEGRPCLHRKPFEPFSPPKDETGEGYPGLCLGKLEGPAYTAVRLYPYYTDRAKPRDVAVAPVLLDPITPGTSHPYFGALLAVRRLRITEVLADTATVALEMASDKQTEESGPRDPFAVLTDFRAMTTVTLPLRDGATASLAGITLTAHRAGAGWTVEPSGRFADWASVSPNGTKVTLGEYSIGPRPR